MTYDASSIRVLKDLEPVKERPGMYTRTTCPTHILQEVIDNAADEALAGYAKRIELTVRRDGCIEIRDDGRGIPVDIHPEEGRPAIELIFCKLHAGGKFDKTSGDGAYRFSGGLHGVGVSVTNALSSRLEVEVKRNGSVHSIVFADGYVVEPLSRIGECGARTSGTRVVVTPNPKYFDSPKVNLGQLEHLLRSKAVLMPGVKVRFSVEGSGSEAKTQEWCFTDGMAGYLSEMAGAADPVAPIFTGERMISEAGAFAVGEGASWALAWYDEVFVKPESYVNLIPTLEGGTHETGLKAGVFEAVRSFIEHHALLPRGLKLVQEDVCGRMSFLLAAKVLDPQFQGQTKEKLTSRDAWKLVQQMVKEPLENWLNLHVEAGKKIAELAIRAANSRQKAAQKVEKRKTSGLATLPGKLTDCESTDISRNEVFLVEGDSAGGSAKQGRDKEFQAILPLRGKVLNTWEVDRDKLFANTEVHDISVALGIDPHTLDNMDSADFSGLRYGKVVILSDADVDGSHIQVLLLTLFVRHFPGLVQRGHVYVAQPPLYRVDGVKQGKSRKIYCQSEPERDQAIRKLIDEGIRETQITVQRFKGLGEMNPEQLWETTLCPDTRTLIQLQADLSDLQALRGTFDLLMAKNQSSGRREWMEREGDKAEADV